MTANSLIRHQKKNNLASCLLYHPPNGTLGLADLDDDTVDWLKRTTLKSDDRSVQTQKKKAMTY